MFACGFLASKLQTKATESIKNIEMGQKLRLNVLNYS